MISGGLAAYQEKSPVTSNTSISDILPYINYLEEDKKRKLNSVQGEPRIDCAASTVRCLALHNGGIMAFNTNETFGGLDNTHVIRVVVDPDGGYYNVTQAVEVFLLPNSQVKLSSELQPGTRSSLCLYEANANKQPDWLYAY